LCKFSRNSWSSQSKTYFCLVEISFKIKIHASCIALVEEKVRRLQQELKASTQSLMTATKSTAGDKHETSRAMIHLEQEKLGAQLLTQQKIEAQLKRIDPNNSHTNIQKGSLIQTDKGFFYLAESIGAVNVGEYRIFALSVLAPLGMLFVGKGIGEKLSFRNNSYTIIACI